ncbi:pantetheine-phosphate adenylyltransferase [Blattabacterium cuenoti]|uniref:pantetheine-phosphate adenylyltransferase n=1 Tax=Blattabacterium cuenoti TaxID=1653831 RepID=UPI00163C4665|nr:pantetheine-phosphate adenylyltransferase [Blattabacterium cuenoti]
MNHDDKKIAVFPGSFDPITIGHYDLVLRSLNLFDKIIIAVGNNSKKNNMFSIEQRIKWIRNTFFQFPKKIEVDVFHGLTISFCKKKKANFLLRGIRNQTDFEFEKNLSFTNSFLNNEHKIETIILLSNHEKSFIRSCIVREIIRNGGDYTLFVPSSVRIELFSDPT